MKSTKTAQGGFNRLTGLLRSRCSTHHFTVPVALGAAMVCSWTGESWGCLLEWNNGEGLQAAFRQQAGTRGVYQSAYEVMPQQGEQGCRSLEADRQRAAIKCRRSGDGAHRKLPAALWILGVAASRVSGTAQASCATVRGLGGVEGWPMHASNCRASFTTGDRPAHLDSPTIV